MRNIIIDLQNSDTWKIQLLSAINFVSSKMLKKSGNAVKELQYKIYIL